MLQLGFDIPALMLGALRFFGLLQELREFALCAERQDCGLQAIDCGIGTPGPQEPVGCFERDPHCGRPIGAALRLPDLGFEIQHFTVVLELRSELGNRIQSLRPLLTLVQRLASTQIILKGAFPLERQPVGMGRTKEAR